MRGGFLRGAVTLVYGEAATGKTSVVIQTAVSAATKGLKVLYVDSDHSFTHQRFHQIAGGGASALSELIMFFLPESFPEQCTLVESLENYLTPTVGLVVVDSITSLYRTAFSESVSIFSLNRDLSRQLAYLNELSSSHEIACLLTSQVRAQLRSPEGEVEPVARRALFHFPSTILQIKNTTKSNVKELQLERVDGIDVTESSCFVALQTNGINDMRT